jgi:hypothetical protein
MKVDYDSEAKSILFEFGEFREVEDGDDTEDVAGGICIVWLRDGRPEILQLLGADRHIEALDEAAERFGLDAEGLRAAARAALAAPDREITIEVGAKISDEERAPEGARAA